MLETVMYLIAYGGVAGVTFSFAASKTDNPKYPFATPFPLLCALMCFITLPAMLCYSLTPTSRAHLKTVKADDKRRQELAELEHKRLMSIKNAELIKQQEKELGFHGH